MSAPTKPKPQELRTTLEAAIRAVKMGKTDWILTVAAGLFCIVTSLFISAESWTSFVEFARVQRNYAWFVVGVLGYQAFLMLVIWLVRKRNKQIQLLKDGLTQQYLSFLAHSELNPQPHRSHDEQSS